MNMLFSFQCHYNNYITIFVEFQVVTDYDIYLLLSFRINIESDVFKFKSPKIQ